MSPRVTTGAAALLLLAGCRLDLGVEVAMAEDGSGAVEVVVAVDEDGMERIGGDLRDVLVVDDLEDTGWTIEGPTIGDDGSTRVRFGHDFADPAEAEEVLASITGDSGPFQDLEVSRDTSFARTRWTFTGRLDFRGGVSAFGDRDLAALLDGEPLGQSQDEIEAQLGEPLSQVIAVRVAVDLPHAPVEEWRVPFGDGAVDLSTTSTERRTVTLVATGAALVGATGLLLYGVVRLRRAVRRPNPPRTGA